jgi:4-hydroxy-tetrahydrodipicolinate synthase
MSSLALRGAFTALVTPFLPEGAIDWPAFERLVEHQLKGGVSGLVPCGTTGECPTLTATEQSELIRRTVELARGEVSVLAGAGSNSTAHALELARAAEKAGADGVMVVMPYYNRPSQEGMLRHVRTIAEGVGLPLVVYNVPARTAVDLKVDTTLRMLDACPNLVGVKDASGNVLYCQDLMGRAKERIRVMCGDDALTLPLMAVGASGVISVTSNVYPKEVEEVTKLVEVGNLALARARHLRLVPIHRALFIEPSPQATKGILAARQLMHPTVRLPLIDAEPSTVERVAAVCRDCLEAS